MYKSVADAWLPFTKGFEGHTTYLYLDVKGLVTIGYGQLQDPILSPILDFRRLDGQPPEAYEVREEWSRVKKLTQLAPLGGAVFRDHTTLRATERSIQELMYAELDSFEQSLRAYFPDYPTWPADAQLGILSMAWACGPHFPLTWPRFTEAAFREVWTQCALECHIDDSHNPGVTPRNVANRTLFLNAAVSDTHDKLTYRV